MKQIGLMFNNQCYSVDQVKSALKQIGVDADSSETTDMTSEGIAVTEIHLLFENERDMESFVVLFFDNYFESVGNCEVDFSTLVLRTETVRIATRIACLTANAMSLLVHQHDQEIAELNERVAGIEASIQRNGLNATRSLLEETIQLLGEAEIIDADETMRRIFPECH